MTSSQDADIARYRSRAIAAAREALRVARHRSADRRRLAENASAAGQEAFAQALGDAADAQDAIARALEGRLRALERRAVPIGTAAAG